MAAPLILSRHRPIGIQRKPSITARRDIAIVAVITIYSTKGVPFCGCPTNSVDGTADPLAKLVVSLERLTID